jgi:YD repeat-containing protein
VQDARGNQTDYTYDPTHGGVLTETAPADVNGIRPQMRYTYVQRKPWLKNSSGGYAAGSPIWKLYSVSYCRTSAAASTGGCTAQNDEVVTTFDYGPDSGPNNLLLRGQVVTADGISHRTCYTYDVFGNMLSETTPNASLTSCP